MTPRFSLIAWSFFDWANSAFSSVVITFIFATYFTKAVAKNPILGTAKWGDTIAIAALGIAILSPIVGAIADNHGQRKPWLGVFTFLLIVTCAALWFIKPHESYTLLALIYVGIGSFAFEVGTVFYNAMLKDLAPPNYLGRISGWAWGLGYLGGLICLILCLFLFVQNNVFHLSTKSAANIRICGPFIGLWILIFSLPLFLFTPDSRKTGMSIKQSIFLGFTQLKYTLHNLTHYKTILLFLLARMLYIDGLNTLFAFGGIYAAGTFNMNFPEVIKFGIAMNVTAGIGAACFAWLDDKIGAKKTILLALLGLVTAGTTTLFIYSKTIFWILALTVGLFVGPAQAASRSLMTRLAPKPLLNEMFGLYALSGKMTAFLGPWLVGLVSLYFDSQRVGMGIPMLLMFLGSMLLLNLKVIG